MPTYEYECEACEHEFILVLTLEEHGSNEPVCPKCGSRHVHQKVSRFFAITSHKA